MKRILGILLMVVALFGAVMSASSTARSPDNIWNLASRTGHYGILTLGAGILVISGGIDLSIGSLVGLSAVIFGLLLEKAYSPALAVVIVLAISPFFGLLHGLLVTKLKLQPFIVTLCGLFIYRGLARWATQTKGGSSRTVGIGGVEGLENLQFLASGSWMGIPCIFLVLLFLAACLSVFLHFSVYGRYTYAVGYNEQAARYAGINSDRHKIVAYIICSCLACLFGIFFILDKETVQPSSTGNWYELYAITGAVLGGCSLRGGEGTIVGMVLGTSVLPLLRNLCQFAHIPDDLEFTVIGVALLIGTIADELVKRRGNSKSG